MQFNPFSAIGAKLSMGLSVLLIGMLMFVGYTKNNEIKALKKERDRLVLRVEQAQGNLLRCQHNGASLAASLARQNASLADLAHATATQADAGLKALGEARKGSTVIRERVVQIGTSKPGPDACKSANDLISETVK